MKLLVATPVPLATPGGAQRLVNGIVDALVSHHGFDVVVAAGSDWPSSPVPPLAQPAREIRLPLIIPPSPVRSLWTHTAALAGARLVGLEGVVTREQPDAILYAPHWSGCAEQAALAAAARHVPFVMCPAIHLDARSHTNRGARRLYRSAALVLALSEQERDWLIRVAAATPDRVLTIRCACRRTIPQPRCASAKDPARLLTVGAFVGHKQIDHQIEAISILRERFGVNAHLTVAGRCADHSALARLTRLVHARDLTDAVELRPNCSDEDIENLHAAADRFLFTSRSESFGLALLDAIGFGTWPIVYPHPIYRTLVDSSGFGSVTEAASPKTLAHAIFASLNAPPADCDHARLQWVASRSWSQAVDPLVARFTASRRLPR